MTRSSSEFPYVGDVFEGGVVAFGFAAEGVLHGSRGPRRLRPVEETQHDAALAAASRPGEDNVRFVADATSYLRRARNDSNSARSPTFSLKKTRPIVQRCVFGVLRYVLCDDGGSGGLGGGGGGRGGYL